MEGHLAAVREAIGNRAFELGVQRKHGSENLAERGEIVIRDPAAEAKELIVEYRSRIDDAEDSLGGNGGLAVMQFHDDARQTLLPEWNQHASAHDRSGIRRNTVGENHVQWHGHGYVAEVGHWLQG